MLIIFFLSFLFFVFGDTYNWSELDIPIEHAIYFFTNNPSIHNQCLMDKDKCPYYEQTKNLPSSDIACWGYEPNCKNNASLIQCSGDSRGWTTTKEKQINEFWRTADFGYIAEKRNELREFCSSSLECVDHLRFCRAKNIYIDFRHIETSKHHDRYREDILKYGDIGGNCKLNRNDLIKNGDHKSPLQSWFSELQVFIEINDTNLFNCDLYITKPTIFIKLDSGYNMYHHFCDFINLYITQHMNNTFTKDIQIILWDTSKNDYWSFFSHTWNAFTSNRLIHIKEFEGKRVCFQNVIFSFLARMFYGFYYNMPLIPGCTQTSLFRSFQQYIIHRLRIPQLGPLKSNQIRITLLNRTTQFRQILNANEIIQHLRNISMNENNDYLINVVDYNINIPFIEQLNITHNTDIFMGMHGAGLTHLLFLPDWATIFEIHNCEDRDCYLDLARLRGVKYFTWENDAKVYPQDEGKHPTLGTPHKKFTNYAFDKYEFARIVRKMVKYVKEHPAYRSAKRMKYSTMNSIPTLQVEQRDTKTSKDEF
ncbi:unnamed protein product [Rotaria sordida]|uniref:EGF domain-specific O-linked N-acetylglucosamine transferase n=1 Tax=Rotaria sordida TaxID=392033 RepID=A0A819M676_9BILA|nr:unnamed protein product [Rotaria sordida]